jgi:hypothetical protein
MHRFIYAFSYMYITVQFLPNFPRKAKLKGFISLEFTTWKFPEACKMHSLGALSDEKVGSSENQGSRNLNHFSRLHDECCRGVRSDHHLRIR